MSKVEIIDIVFDGIALKCPSSCALPLKKYTYESFPTNFCGAGKGMGEALVPDFVFGPTRFLKFLGLDVSIKISPACFIHDEDWFLADPTWNAFYASNERFHENIESIINAKARNEYIKARALYRPVTYKNAVDLAGRYVFWTMKWKTCTNIPFDALKYVNHRR